MRPTVILRRNAITKGVFGGSRGWLVMGGMVWVGRWFKNLFGTGEPTTRYVSAVGPGERLVFVHEPDSPLVQRKAAKRSAKAADRATKAAAAAARADRKAAKRAERRNRRA